MEKTTTLRIDSHWGIAPFSSADRFFRDLIHRWQSEKRTIPTALLTILANTCNGLDTVGNLATGSFNLLNRIRKLSLSDLRSFSFHSIFAAAKTDLAPAWHSAEAFTYGLFVSPFSPLRFCLSIPSYRVDVLEKQLDSLEDKTLPAATAIYTSVIGSVPAGITTTLPLKGIAILVDLTQRLLSRDALKQEHIDALTEALKKTPYHPHKDWVGPITQSLLNLDIELTRRGNPFAIESLFTEIKRPLGPVTTDNLQRIICSQAMNLPIEETLLLCQSAKIHFPTEKLVGESLVRTVSDHLLSQEIAPEVQRNVREVFAADYILELLQNLMVLSEKKQLREEGLEEATATLLLLPPSCVNDQSVRVNIVTGLLRLLSYRSFNDQIRENFCQALTRCIGNQNLKATITQSVLTLLSPPNPKLSRTLSSTGFSQGAFFENASGDQFRGISPGPMEASMSSPTEDSPSRSHARRGPDSPSSSKRTIPTPRDLKAMAKLMRCAGYIAETQMNILLVAALSAIAEGDKETATPTETLAAIRELNSGDYPKEQPKLIEMLLLLAAENKASHPSKTIAYCIELTTYPLSEREKRTITGILLGKTMDAVLLGDLAPAFEQISRFINDKQGRGSNQLIPILMEVTASNLFGSDACNLESLMSLHLKVFQLTSQLNPGYVSIWDNLVKKTKQPALVKIKEIFAKDPSQINVWVNAIERSQVMYGERAKADILEFLVGVLRTSRLMTLPVLERLCSALASYPSILMFPTLIDDMPAWAIIVEAVIEKANELRRGMGTLPAPEMDFSPLATSLGPLIKQPTAIPGLVDRVSLLCA